MAVTFESFSNISPTLIFDIFFQPFFVLINVDLSKHPGFPGTCLLGCTFNISTIDATIKIIGTETKTKKAVPAAAASHVNGKIQSTIITAAIIINTKIHI